MRMFDIKRNVIIVSKSMTNPQLKPACLSNFEPSAGFYCTEA